MFHSRASVLQYWAFCLFPSFPGSKKLPSAHCLKQVHYLLGASTELILENVIEVVNLMTAQIKRMHYL